MLYLLYALALSYLPMGNPVTFDGSGQTIPFSTSSYQFAPFEVQGSLGLQWGSSDGLYMWTKGTAGLYEQSIGGGLFLSDLAEYSLEAGISLKGLVNLSVSQNYWHAIPQEVGGQIQSFFLSGTKVTLSIKNKAQLF